MASLLKQRNEALYGAFASVETNAGALYVALKAIRHAEAAQVDLAGYPWDYAAQRAIRSLGDYIRQIKMFAQPFFGSDPNAPLSQPSWAELRHSIGGTYALIWAIEDTLSPDARDTFGTLGAQITIDAIEAVPKVIEAVLDYAADLAGKAAAGAAKIPKKILWEFLKEAWPVLLGAVVIVGAGIYIAVGTNTGRAVVKARTGV